MNFFEIICKDILTSFYERVKSLVKKIRKRGKMRNFEVSFR